MSSLSHPNIIKLHGIANLNNKIQIIMEYCEMPDLFKLIHNKTKEEIKEILYFSGVFFPENEKDVCVPIDTFYTIFLDIARSLKYLHTLRPPIVHSDIR